MKFQWKYCKGCHTSYIECPKCGNNCCNGGVGNQLKSTGIPLTHLEASRAQYLYDKGDDIVDCDVCQQAYEYQQEGWDNHTDPWYYRFRSWCHNIYINLRYEFYHHHLR